VLDGGVEVLADQYALALEVKLVHAGEGHGWLLGRCGRSLRSRVLSACRPCRSTVAPVRVCQARGDLTSCSGPTPAGGAGFRQEVFVSHGLVLYSYWRSSAAYRVRIALNLKQLPYETRPVHLVRDGVQQHAESYRRLNPQA